MSTKSAIKNHLKNHLINDKCILAKILSFSGGANGGNGAAGRFAKIEPKVQAVLNMKIIKFYIRYPELDF